jgi:hypothetical protein
MTVQEEIRLLVGSALLGILLAAGITALNRANPQPTEQHQVETEQAQQTLPPSGA